MAKVHIRKAQDKQRRPQASRSQPSDPPKAEDKTAVPRPKPNWIRYPAKGMARLYEAVALTCDLAPEAVAHDLEEQATTYTPIPEDLNCFFDRLKAALSAANHGFPASTDDDDIFSAYMPWLARVPLGRFAKWVVQEGWTPVPQEFLRLCDPQGSAAMRAPGGQRSADSSVSTPETLAFSAPKEDPRERNKMLTMIAAMWKGAYAEDILSKAAADIAHDAEKIGLRLDSRTASKYLREAAGLIPQNRSGEDWPLHLLGNCRAVAPFLIHFLDHWRHEACDIYGCPGQR